MPTKEALLAEVEDVLRTQPNGRQETKADLAWLGRAAAVIEAWDPVKHVALHMALHRLHDEFITTSALGYRELTVLLNQAQHALRLETVGPLNAAIGQGRVFEYFDELRKILEMATSAVLFVDPYLDADFVARYLPILRSGIAIKLLTTSESSAGPKRLSVLIAAVTLFAKEHNQNVLVRTATGLHDRYLFVDSARCYHSGASFKDGGRKAGTIISQVTDAFQPMLNTYSDIWETGTIHPISVR